MFEHEVPFHIQEEIMKRLPVKSLIQFRSVSKAWKSLIDSSEFIADHCVHRRSRQQHLLVSYGDMSEVEEYELICQSYIDDDTFPQQRSVLTPPPPCAQQILRQRVVCSSHGLVCLCGLHPSFETYITIIWNPSIRKFIVVDEPALAKGFGFGVCPVTNDPKMVSIKQSSWDEPETSYICEVMVYTLSSGKWRSLSTNLPAERIRGWCLTVVTDGFIYWLVELHTHNMIISFDVTNESFEVVYLPDTLAHHDPKVLHITKLRESLAILEYTGNICTVWMMEDGVQRSFTKLFTITTPPDSIVGFRKNGMPIMKVTEYDDGDEPFKLVVYEPNSEHRNAIGISGPHLYLDISSYMETLLLFGQSDCTSY